MAVFCIAIKGNDRRCRNYAWKKCDEQLCWQHRNLSDKKVEEFKEIKEVKEIDPDICYTIGCKSKVTTYIISHGSKKQYSCWRHSLREY